MIFWMCLCHAAGADIPAFAGIIPSTFLLHRGVNMPFNLIEDSWVPVRRATGPPEYIPPWKASLLEPEPWLDLAAVRPDLGGAAWQMLVGLLQVACAPEDDAAWLAWYQNPPRPELLYEKMLPLKAAFFLQGEHPFMQDKKLPA